MTLWKKHSGSESTTTKDESLPRPKLDTSVNYPKGLKLRVVDATVLTEGGRKATSEGELAVEEVHDAKLTTVF